MKAASWTELAWYELKEAIFKQVDYLKYEADSYRKIAFFWRDLRLKVQQFERLDLTGELPSKETLHELLNTLDSGYRTAVHRYTGSPIHAHEKELRIATERLLAVVDPEPLAKKLSEMTIAATSRRPPPKRSRCSSSCS
jgi:hypothetical protein